MLTGTTILEPGDVLVIRSNNINIDTVRKFKKMFNTQVISIGGDDVISVIRPVPQKKA
jgi:hypothetical protein